MSAVLSGYIPSLWRVHAHTVSARTYRRVFDSMDYFRRSFPRGGSNWAATVSLATAFEMLLTDGYAGGVGKVLARRTGALLHGRRGRRSYQAAVEALYTARSEIVHGSSWQAQFDLKEAQQAYVLAFTALAPRLARLRHATGTPIADLIDLN